MKKKAKRRAKPVRKAAKKTKARKAVKAKAVSKKSAKPKKAKKAPKTKKPKTAKQPPKSGVVAPPNSTFLGQVEDYFAHIGVIALTLLAAVPPGSKIQVLGHTTRIEQPVESMQIDHLPVAQATQGQAVGIKVINRARRGDRVYLLR